MKRPGRPSDLEGQINEACPRHVGNVGLAVLASAIVGPSARGNAQRVMILLTILPGIDEDRVYGHKTDSAAHAHRRENARLG